ncbi:MAG: NAD(P)-dependent oxidoreductase, partial [Bacteroidetes bacterium]|nr:NAD(P)-dependent oxidoreductase [Bacteroidota bacterium]
MAKNILITGISGFVGSNLTSYLKPAWDVSAISTSKVQSHSDLKHVYTWDQLSVDVISQFDCVIHLAG